MLLGGHQPRVLPQEPNALQRAGQEILAAKDFGRREGFRQRSEEGNDRILLPEESLVGSLENLGFAALSLATQEAAGLQPTRHVKAGVKQLLDFCVTRKEFFVWQTVQEAGL